MTAAEIVKKLEALGKESYKSVILKHGINEPVFGVSIEELKKFQKQIKQDYQLALDLYDTGIYDAQYLAGLIADDARMTKKDLGKWIATGNSAALCNSIVAWVAAGSKHGREMGLEWIDSKKENEAQTGWSTLSSLVAITDDAHLDIAELKRLLKRVEQTIHRQPNRVRYTMNGFVIAVGTYVAPLTELALQTGEKIGKVEVDVGDTSCKVPYSPEYIEKARKLGVIGKKRKTAKC